VIRLVINYRHYQVALTLPTTAAPIPVVCVHVHDQSGGNLIAQGRKRKQHELYVVAPPDNYAIINRKPAIFSMSCYFATSARLSFVSSPIRRSYGA